MSGLAASRWRGIMRLARHLLTTRRWGGVTLPYKVEFYLTDRCDSRCGTCGCWRRPPGPSEELTADRIIHAAASLGPRLLWVGLSGGEPTLREDFAEIARGIARACPRLVLLNFGTNGLNPGRVIERAAPVAALDIPFISAALSIDGVGEVHDRVRGVRGAFERLVETATALVELEGRHPNFILSFQTTVSPLNRDAVRDIPAFLAENFPDHPYFATIAADSYMVGRGADGPVAAGTAEIGAVRDLAAAGGKWGLFDLVPRAYLGWAPHFLRDNKSPVGCVAGRDMITVDPYGNVRPCDYVERPVANLSQMDDDLARLLSDPVVRDGLNRFINCRLCFTPCQAYPSLIRSPFDLMVGYLRSFRH